MPWMNVSRDVRILLSSELDMEREVIAKNRVTWKSAAVRTASFVDLKRKANRLEQERQESREADRETDRETGRERDKEVENKEEDKEED